MGPESSPTPIRSALSATAALAGVGWSAAASQSQAQGEQAPGEVDLGFLRDMSVHHAQALTMCQRVLGRDNGDPVQAAAAEILQNQSYESDLMHAWLQSWARAPHPPPR